MQKTNKNKKNPKPTKASPMHKEKKKKTVKRNCLLALHLAQKDIKAALTNKLKEQKKIISINLGKYEKVKGLQLKR